MDAAAGLAIALGLGLLVGVQRERADPDIAGLRTFGLTSLLGGVCALLGGWMVPTGLGALAAVVLLGNFIKVKAGELEPGQTTEVALLLMFAVGAMAVTGPRPLAVAVGGATAVLLHFKKELHAFTRGIDDADFRAVIQFVLLTLVILPVLPSRTYGPYDVLNPREVWLMVVLIVGIGLGGYLGYKRFGRGAGTLLGGVLGGLVSSTATTVSYARRSESGESDDRLALRVILIASVVVFARVLVEIGVVAPGFLATAGPPIAALGVVLAVVTVVAWLVGGRAEGSAEMPEHSNPSELRPALVFGALYALVLLAVAWAKDVFGGGGIYVVAVISGLTDMDAITLSTSRLVEAGTLEAAVGWQAVVVAALSNLVFKGGIVAVWGSRQLLRHLAIWWGVTAIAGIAILALWP